MNESLRTVRTAGGLLFQNAPDAHGVIRPHVWLIANREDARAVRDGNQLSVRYQIPKGHQEPGETDEVTAVREVYEETGHRTRAGQRLGKICRPAWEYEDGVRIERVCKVIAVFAMELDGNAEDALPKAETDEQAELVPMDDRLPNLMRYREEATFLAQLDGQIPGPSFGDR